MGVDSKKQALITAELIGFLALLCCAIFMFLWNVGASSISVRSDEVIYVRTTQSILHNGDLFPLKHGAVPMFEKPPLKLWLGSIFPFILGESNFSFRLLDGLLGVCVVGVTALLAYTMTSRPIIALGAGSLLLGMPELVIAQHSFRHAVLDGLLCALILLGALYSWRVCALKRYPSWDESCILGALWSLAVLTKSVAGLVPAACSLISLATVQRGASASSSWKRLAPIVLIPIVTFGAYALALRLCVGQKALSIFLGVEILQRIFSGFQGHNTGSAGFYLWYLFARAGGVPQALLVSGLVGACICCRRRSELRFLLVWSVLPVALYSCAASRVPWYLSPYLPMLSILSIIGTDSLARCFNSSRAYVIIVAFIAALSIPPFFRAVQRNVLEVLHDTERLEIDRLVEQLKGSYTQFAIVENAISGHSNPRRGRFNVEGIYRESLRPHLRAIKQLSELEHRANEVLLVRESHLADLTPGWLELGRLAPYGSRTWGVVAIIYPAEDVEGGG